MLKICLSANCKNRVHLERNLNIMLFTTYLMSFEHSDIYEFPILNDGSKLVEYSHLGIFMHFRSCRTKMKMH